VNQTSQLYRFGEFSLDRATRRLMKGSDVVSLTPKAFDTLLVLIESGGRIVDKQELMDRVWPGVAVEENNLTQNISALRKALGDKSAEPRFILTIPGQGYRFVAELEPQPEAPAAAEVKPPARRRLWIPIAAGMVVFLTAGGIVAWRLLQRGAQLNSIAVLPFRSLAQVTGDDYLGMGLADVLITKLSNLHGILVRPTSSVVRYSGGVADPAQAGRDLQVDAVLDGRVQRSADRIRVTVQLLRSSDGATLWADKFDEQFTDVFNVEDRVTEEVARALVRSLDSRLLAQLDKHYTDNPKAHEAYLEGRYWWNRRNPPAVHKAIECYERAIAADPSYALAYAGLADSWAALGILSEPPLETFPKAKRAALDALRIDERLAEAHAALGYVEHRFDWDWSGAPAEFKRAIELSPNYPQAHQWLGWYYMTLRRFGDAEKEFETARTLDPGSLYANTTLGTMYFYAGRLDDAIAQLKRTLEMDPTFIIAHRWLSRVYEQKHMFPEAEAETRKNIELTKGDAKLSPSLGCVYAAAGRTGEARKILANLEEKAKTEYVEPFMMAFFYALLGDHGKALDWLERCADLRSEILVDLNIEPRFVPLRNEPRFKNLLKRVGLI